MKRILIIKPSSMGDILHAFPAVHALMASDPGITIDWVIHPAYAELLDYLPGLRRKIHFQRQKLGHFSTFFSAARDLLKELRQERYDAVIDLQGLFRSALIGLFARTSHRYGPAEAREKPAELCYRHKLHCPAGVIHALERNCALMEDFSGLKQISPEYRLPVVEKYARSVDRLLAGHGLTGKKFIAVTPGTRWATKQWPPEFFGAVIRQCAEQLKWLEFVLLGSTAEKSVCEAVRKAAGGVPVTDFSGLTTPGELAELIRRAEILVCNDSGPMHIAPAAGTPVIALFGPTLPTLTGPYGPNCRVIQPKLDCIGCLSKTCISNRCHEAVNPSQVAETALALLKEGA